MGILFRRIANFFLAFFVWALRFFFMPLPKVLFTIVSRNAKTGPIPVSMSVKNTCPDACPLKAGGCYASGGPVNLHWLRVSAGKAGILWGEFLKAVKGLHVGQLWRHNQAGDLPGINNTIDTKALAELVQANKGKRGFTYTHKPVLTGQASKATVATNRKAIASANAGGFTVNLSGNTLTHADELADLAIGPVVTLLPITQTRNTVTPKGRKVVVCPAAIRDGVSCATCKLCQWGKRGFVIGFPAHGVSSAKANAIANS